MAQPSDLQAAERSIRELLERDGLPEPDDVEYREASIVLLWRDRKVAVVVDVAQGPA